MKRLVFLVFCCFIIGCAKSDDEFFNTQKEIMLRSAYVNNAIISYLGHKNGNDYVVISSKAPVNKVYLDNNLNNFQAILKDEFNLPYKSDFLYTYKAIAKANKNETLECKIILENNEEILVTLQRISKSLNYIK